MLGNEKILKNSVFYLGFQGEVGFPTQFWHIIAQSSYLNTGSGLGTSLLTHSYI